MFEIFRKQAQLRNIRKRNLSGCARAEGRDITESNAFTNRITNLAKVRRVVLFLIHTVIMCTLYRLWMEMIVVKRMELMI